jgi:type II secretory pathway component PulK
MVDLSELMLIKGMDPAYAYKLSQYITAIPVSLNGQLTTESAAAANQNQESAAAAPTGPGLILVNVNTAPAEVIAAKSGIPLPVASRMTTIRENTVFKTQQDITSFLTSNGIILSQNTSQGTTTINPATLTTSSSYFTIHAAVDKGDYEFKWVEMVYRANRSGQWPQVLWHHPE